MSDETNLQQPFAQGMARCRAAVRYVFTEAVGAMQETLGLVRRTTMFAISQLYRWQLAAACSQSQLIVGEAALASGQGDDRIRAQLSMTRADGATAVRGRERRRLLRQLAADVKVGHAEGETAKLAQELTTREAALSQLTSQLAADRRGLLPTERTDRRRIGIGGATIVALSLLFVCRAPGEATTNVDVANASRGTSELDEFDGDAASTSPVESDIKSSSAPRQLLYQQTSAGLVIANPMISFGESLTLAISFVVIPPDHAGSHDVRGLVAVVDIYDFEETKSHNGHKFVKVIFHADEKQFSLLLPDPSGTPGAMRYSFKDMEARKLHDFLYLNCLLSGQPLALELAGRRYNLNKDDVLLISALAAGVGREVRSQGYEVAPYLP